MTQFKRIGIDTSKAVFTLHGIDQAERPTLRVNLRRAQMIGYFTKLAPTEIAMEACGGAHHWARELSALGHAVHLDPAAIRDAVCQTRQERPQRRRGDLRGGRASRHAFRAGEIRYATGSGHGPEGA